MSSDFVVLPPEINSARIYAGPGPGPMLEAAAAWEGIGTELSSAANAFSSITSDLAGQAWQGPASASMTNAAAAYVGWLSAASSQAEQAAGQARAAAGACETALAAAVPPPLIAANRAQLMSLIATNVLGQNTPAIAATEAQYEAMWAQNVAMMSSYHASALAVASQLTKFSEPPPGLAGAAQTAAVSAGTQAQSVMSTAPRLLSELPRSLGLASSFTAGLSSAASRHLALIMGGTGVSQPSPDYVATLDSLYIAPNYPGYTSVGFYTPEDFWPFTGLTSATFGQSVHEGALLLDNAIMTQTAAGNHIVALGVSQSATMATLEMRHLDALPVGARPSPNQLSFMLLGDPNNPNGGPLERFNGLYIPGLDVLFNGATPPDTPYQTTIYTVQYDGIADFPQYPIDLPADANALAGMFTIHYYGDAAQLATAVQEPVSPGYTGATTYYMIPTQNLPLLYFLRQIPVVGNPLADLVQPDLRVIVDLGYGDGYANVPTPAGLFPTVNWCNVSADLCLGAQQGVIAAGVDMGLLPASDLPNAYPYLPYVP